MFVRSYMVTNLSKLISQTKALNAFLEIPRSIMLNLYSVVIKGLREPANLLEMKTVKSSLTNHCFICCTIFTMNEKAEIIKEVYETIFGTADGTYKLVVKEH